MGLSSLEQKYISKNFYSFEHNWKIDTYLFGEPYLHNNYLIYRTDKDLSICLYSFDDSNINYSDLDSFYEEFRNNELETLKFYGPLDQIDKVISYFPHTYNKYYISDVNANEIIINTNSVSKKALQSYNASIKKNYYFNFNNQYYLKKTHIDLMRNFYISKNLFYLDKAFFLLLPVLCKRNDVLFAEAFSNNVLIGFYVMHKYEEDKYVILMSFFNDDYKYVNDFLLGNVCNKVLSENSVIFWGPAANNGILKFKLKWGVENKAKAPHSIIYKKERENSSLGLWWVDMYNQWLNKTSSIVL